MGANGSGDCKKIEGNLEGNRLRNMKTMVAICIPIVNPTHLTIQWWLFWGIMVIHYRQSRIMGSLH